MRATTLSQFRHRLQGQQWTETTLAERKCCDRCDRCGFSVDRNCAIWRNQAIYRQHSWYQQYGCPMDHHCRKDFDRRLFQGTIADRGANSNYDGNQRGGSERPRYSHDHDYAVIGQPSVGSSSADNKYCGAGDQANFGTNDGPATLPQRCINTALSNTPSGGKQTLVPAGGDPNSALDNAACGDVILLQAGATFKKPVTLPAKNCDAQHWITVRTSAADSSLPAEGTRLTPCYAGVSSLPGRPAYSCSSAQNVLAKIEIATGEGAISVAPGANYYRIIGLEITRQSRDRDCLRPRQNHWHSGSSDL